MLSAGLIGIKVISSKKTFWFFWGTISVKWVKLKRLFSAGWKPRRIWKDDPDREAALDEKLKTLIATGSPNASLAPS
jgi:hypothetical protein